VLAGLLARAPAAVDAAGTATMLLLSYPANHRYPPHISRTQLIRGLFFYWIFRGAATRLHNLMFSRVIRAPLSYFTNTPVGRILSVFSKDQDTIDEALLDAIHMTVIYTAILCTTAGVVIRVVPYFAAIVGALLVVFVYYFRVYMRASASIKALSGSTTSLLLAHVSETLSGMAVIHAFRAQQRFVDDNRRRLVNMHLASRTMDDLQGWLSFRLDFVASLLVLGTCLLMVGLQASIPASGAGLAISNSFQILLFLSLAVKGAAEIHANIPSVERVVQLTRVEEEVDVPLTHESCPAESWPAHGAVSFHGVVMSYARDTPAVLKGVDFSVEPGEKVGIVGRTGEWRWR
jgi:ABC-type multidrug transport system fused ATPase/permease subunit